MYENIPNELKQFNSWICWRGELKENGKTTKIPLQTTNGYKADVTNPFHWNTFQQSVEIAQTYLANEPYGGGIGFCLNCNDPYAIVDLDDVQGDQEAFERQLKIYHSFNSYSEVSPSGKGLHIVCKGKLEVGRKKAHVEVYSRDRFFTFTGLRYNNEPIQDRQDLLNILWAEMGEGRDMPTNIESSPQFLEDGDLLQRATDAANGDKFLDLFQGRWANYYQSQSEADFALINMFSFYTQNVEQVKRLWAMSELSKRNKQTSIKGVPYLDHMIMRSFDRQLPFIDLDQIRIGGLTLAETKEGAAAAATTPSHRTGESNTQAQPGNGAANAEASPRSAAAAANLAQAQLAVKLQSLGEPQWPPGLLGEIAAFIYAQAARPVYEIALAGAIGFMSGICGRSYNVSGTGLNQYVLVLAMTGANKEAAASGISKLVASIRTHVPMVTEFMGPGDIKSDAGLIKWLDRKPCFLSIVGEFGLRFQQMVSTRGIGNEIGIKKALLDLYNKSGKGASLNPLAYSDKANNTNVIASPSFSILGEGTPETFYSSISEDVILDGLLPRFLIIEYKGNSPPLSKKHAQAIPNKALIDNLCSLVSQNLAHAQNNKTIDVRMTSEAELLFDKLEYEARQIINNSKETVRQLWNRAHVKSLKLAAIRAVGINPYDPVIDKASAEWAIGLVNADVKNIASKFNLGEVGEESKTTFASDDNQLEEIIKIIRRFIKKESVPNYGMTNKMLADGIYTFSSIQQLTCKVACYRKDKMGSTFAFKRAMQNLLDNGDIQELNPIQMEKVYSRRGRCFKIVDYDRFA